MKKIFPFLLIPIFVACQNQSYNSFIHNIGGTDFDEVYSIFVDNNQNLITAGVFHNELKWNGKTQFSAKGKTDLFVIKSNIQGEKIWSKKIGGTENDWIYSVKSDSIGNVFLAGQTAVKTSGVGLITKLDVEGNIIWKYEHNSTSEFFDVLQTSNKIFCSGTINGKAAIITLNKNGVKINELHFPGEGIVRGFSLINKSSFYVFGINNKKGLIAKLNLDLKIQFKTTLSELGPSIILTLISDEIGIIAGGQVYNHPLNSQKKIGKEDAFVASLSHDLKIKRTILNGSTEKDWTRSICRVNKGQYVISTIANKNSIIFNSDIKNSKGNFDISLSLVDDQLNLISQKTIDSALEEGVNSLQFSKGYIYMGGWFQGSLEINERLNIEDNKNGNGFVVKCDLKNLFK